MADVARQIRADFVINHLFGGAPAVAIKELKHKKKDIQRDLCSTVATFKWLHFKTNKRRLISSKQERTAD